MLARRRRLRIQQSDSLAYALVEYFAADLAISTDAVVIWRWRHHRARGRAGSPARRIPGRISRSGGRLAWLRPPEPCFTVFGAETGGSTTVEEPTVRVGQVLEIVVLPSISPAGARRDELLSLRSQNSPSRCARSAGVEDGAFVTATTERRCHVEVTRTAHPSTRASSFALRAAGSPLHALGRTAEHRGRPNALRVSCRRHPGPAGNDHLLGL